MAFPRRLQLEGYVVNRCIVDFAFSLDFVTGPMQRTRATLRIEAPFTIEISGESWTLDAEKDISALGPALGLFQRIVEGASVGDDGQLDIRLSGNARLVAHTQPKYEAWTMNLPDGALLVSGVGGRVSYFPPRRA